MTKILTTMWDGGNSEWSRSTDLLDRRKMGLLVFWWKFVKLALHYDVVVVVGALGARDRYADLMAVALTKLRRRRPFVVVSDATWELGSNSLRRRLPVPGVGTLLRLISRGAIRKGVDSKRTVYCVLSTEELTSFPATWGIDPDRVRFTPFSTTIWEPIEVPAVSGDYIFAGGNSLRDYSLLLEAVSGLDVPVRIAASGLRQPLPSNVVADSVTSDEYMRLFAGCRLAVVSLRHAVRSAGQQTYLNAMALGKPVIVTEAPGVRDYIDHGRTGLVVAPRAGDLRDAILWVLDPANAEEVDAMISAARAAVNEHFGPTKYRRRLLEVAEDVVARGASAGGAKPQA